MPRSKKATPAKAKTKSVKKPHPLEMPVKPIISLIVIALAAAGLLLAVQASQKPQNLASDAAGGCSPGAQKCASSTYYQKCGSNGQWHWQTYKCGSSNPYCVNGQCTSNKPHFDACDGYFIGVNKSKPLTVKVGEKRVVGINPGSGKTIRVVCDQTKSDPKIYTLTINEDKTSPFQCKIKGENPGTHNLRVRLWKDPGTEKVCYINTKVTVTE